MRKGQAAMEFLMTYGWAILVVLAAIGALAYFGVLSPSRFLPSACQMPSGIGCTDFKVSENMFQFNLRNNLGADLSVFNMNVSGDGYTFCPAVADWTITGAGGAVFTFAPDTTVMTMEFLSPAATTFRNGQQILHAECIPSTGVFKGSTSTDFTLMWMKSEETLSHGGFGKMTLKVES